MEIPNQLALNQPKLVSCRSQRERTRTQRESERARDRLIARHFDKANFAQQMESSDKDGRKRRDDENRHVAELVHHRI
jgi:hypothetical protein